MRGKVRVFYAIEIIRNFCSSDSEYSKLHALYHRFKDNNIFKINTLVIVKHTPVQQADMPP